MSNPAPGGLTSRLEFSFSQLQHACLKVCCSESEDLGCISVILIEFELVIQYIMFRNPGTGKDSLVFVMHCGNFQGVKIPVH